MSDIPKARALLDQMTKDYAGTFFANRLKEVLPLLTREPAVRKTRKKLPPLTELQKQYIRNYARDNPDASQLEIANRFGTNPGRVSEALNERELLAA